MRAGATAAVGSIASMELDEGTPAAAPSAPAPAPRATRSACGAANDMMAAMRTSAAAPVLGGIACGGLREDTPEKRASRDAGARARVTCMPALVRCAPHATRAPAARGAT